MLIDNFIVKRHDDFVTPELFFPIALKGIVVS